MLHRQKVVKLLEINCHITVWGLIWVRGMSPIGLWDVFMEWVWVFIFFQVVQFQVVEVLNTVIIGIVFVKCPVQWVKQEIFAQTVWREHIKILQARVLVQHVQRAKRHRRAALP